MARQLNGFAEEMPAPAITLPKFNLPPLDEDAETKEAAERFFKHRCIRAGAAAWRAASADKTHSFEAYKAIGAALLIGRDHAMKAVGVDTPHGRRYSGAFRQWMQNYGFGGMPEVTRKHIVMLTENAAAIESWRAGLPQRERNRIGNAQHMVRRWQASRKNGHGKCLAYVRRDAIAGWRKFLSSVAMLPPDQAAPLWAMVYDEARIADAA
jgi:hypothetical protein